MTMTPVSYAGLAMRTAKHFDQHNLYLIHAALGLTSDSAELCEVLLQRNAYGVDRHVRAASVEELGDVLWFLVYATAAHTGALDLPERQHWFSAILENAASVPVELSHGKYMLVDSTALLDALVTLDGDPTEADYGLALSAACGQYATLVKSQVVYGGNVTNAAYLNALLIVGKVMARCLRGLELPWEEVAQANITKLQMRYPSTYTDVAALQRADKQDPQAVQAQRADTTADPQRQDDVLHAAAYSSSAISTGTAPQEDPAQCGQQNQAENGVAGAGASCDSAGGTPD